jgi:hypothetical protein
MPRVVSGILGKALAVVVLAFVLAGLPGSAWSAPPSLTVTLIDAEGNQHELTQFAFRGAARFDYYVNGERRVVSFADIDRIRFEGNAQAEEQDVIVSLRSGRQERGRFATGASISADQNTDGGGGDTRGFSGNTQLGPFFRRAGQVREIIFRHADGQTVVPEAVLKATVITEDGRRFDLTGLRCRGTERLDYRVGGRDRFAELAKVAAIEFEPGHQEAEWRPAMLTLRSGRRTLVEVEASVVRLAGETDKAYFERVNGAITGTTSIGPVSLGVRDIKQMRFAPDPGSAAPDSAPGADSTAARAAADSSGK